MLFKGRSSNSVNVYERRGRIVRAAWTAWTEVCSEQSGVVWRRKNNNSKDKSEYGVLPLRLALLAQGQNDQQFLIVIYDQSNWIRDSMGDLTLELPNFLSR